MGKVIDRMRADHGDPLRYLDRIPRTATELYYTWTGVAPKKSLNRRERNERRCLAKHLVRLSTEGIITRGVATENGHTYIAFWRDSVDADVSGSDQPRRAAAGGEARRPDGRGVVE